MLQQRILRIKPKQYQAWHDKAWATVKNKLFLPHKHELSYSFPNQTKLNANQSVKERVQPIYFRKLSKPRKRKTKTKMKKKTPQEQHNCAWNNKNKAFGRNLGFLLMKKRMPWASPSFDACTSWIFLRVTRMASPSLSFSPSFISLLIPSIHLKFFLHTKLNTIFISNISALKIISL